MPYGVKPPFANGEIYHLYNRGVAKEAVLAQNEDVLRFLVTLSFYREATPISRLSLLPKSERQLLETTPVLHPIVEILAYCIMPTHFHLIVRQLVDGGISTFMRRALNSYTRAYNTVHNRVGSVFQGVYQAVHISSDEQFLHVCRYTHLNPYVAKLVDNPEQFRWSSYPQTLLGADSRLCTTSFLIQIIGSTRRYRGFVTDYASYARDLAAYKDLLIDINE